MVDFGALQLIPGVRRLIASATMCCGEGHSPARAKASDVMAVLMQVIGRSVLFARERRLVWLPQVVGVILPPTSEARVIVNLALVEDAPGSYILEWQGPSLEYSGTLWYPSPDAALEAAEERFGIRRHEWRDSAEPTEQG